MHPLLGRWRWFVEAKLGHGSLKVSDDSGSANAQVTSWLVPTGMNCSFAPAH